MLQCVAVCCSMLQCVAVCCSGLQWVAVGCTMLRCVAVCCRALQCHYLRVATAAVPATVFVLATALHCNTLRHAATRCNTLHHTATHCNISHCNTLQHMSSILIPTPDVLLDVVLRRAGVTVSFTATLCNTLQ